MSRYLVIGSGAVGTAVAERLAASGHRVTVATRRGSGPTHPLVDLDAVDATDGARMEQLARGSAAIFNCANPPYHRWPSDWPPIANSLLDAAEASGAVLVTTANLYPYGVPDGLLSPETPLRATYEKARVRARMWDDALRAHRTGRIRATEVRASDYVGPGSQSIVSQRFVPRILLGKGCLTVGDPDAPHGWTYVDDVARTLIACAENPNAWGRVWHAPTNPARSQREVIDDVADAAGVTRVRVSRIPTTLIRAMGLFSPLLRELPKTLYQFEAPFVIDDSATRHELGLEPTPWHDILVATIAGGATAVARRAAP